MKIVYRPTARVLTVLCDIKHKMDLETVSLKDLFGSLVYQTLHHRACGRTISFLFFLITSKLFHIALYPLIFERMTHVASTGNIQLCDGQIFVTICAKFY
jgi:hypothetical protein